MSHDVAAEFMALDLDGAADAALAAATAAGAEHVDVRVERVRRGFLSARDGMRENASDDVDLGLSVRVLRKGTWGFVAVDEVSPDAAAAAARRAVTWPTCAPHWQPSVSSSHPSRATRARGCLTTRPIRSMFPSANAVH